MAGIIYTASSRAPLITDSPAHVAGTQYSIDLKLQQFTEAIDTPKSTHVSLGGNVETVLRRANKTMQTGFIWPDADNADIEEFLYSIAGGETFSFDAYGTIAVPVNAIDVICVNDGFSMGRLTHGDEPWRSVALSLRAAI